MFIISSLNLVSFELLSLTGIAPLKQFILWLDEKKGEITQIQLFNDNHLFMGYILFSVIFS